jgi:di/tripeptidase
MNNRQYVIINAADVSTINFDDVLETSTDTLRYNVAGDETFVKYEGAKPRCLYGKDTLSHSAMLTVLAGEAWTETIEEL